MAYTFEQIEARDPANPELIAANALVTIFAPGDTTQTPLKITTTQGWPLPNPIQVNSMGYGPAFMHETLSRVAWSGGEHTGFFTAHDSIKQDAVAAADRADRAAAAAEEAARNAQAPTSEQVDEGIARADLPGQITSIVEGTIDGLLTPTVKTITAESVASALTGNAAWSGPLKHFGDALENKETAPCIWVNLGSSTAAGTGADTGLSWAARVAARITANPLTPLANVSSRPTSGVWAYTAAVSGTTTTNYLTETTVARIQSLQPTLITHMIGSNDWGSGSTTDTYKANLRAALSRLVAVSPDTVHVLIHQQTRQDHNPPTPWHAYSTAMEEVAAEFTQAVFLDVGQFFNAYGLTRTEDRAGLLVGDKIHVNNVGHRILAELIAAYLGVPIRADIEKFKSGPINGGTKTADGTFATVTVPPRPYPRKVTLTAQAFMGATSGTPDVQLRNGTEIGYAIRMDSTAMRASRSGSCTWDVPANTSATLNVTHAPNVYLTTSDLYAQVYAESVPA